MAKKNIIDGAVVVEELVEVIDMVPAVEIAAEPVVVEQKRVQPAYQLNSMLRG